MLEYHPRLIAISGVSRAGKNKTSSFVHEFATEMEASHRERGFADKLKWSLARIFYPDITMENAIEWCDALKASESYSLSVITRIGGLPSQASTVEHSILMRDALRNYGTEAARDIFGDNFWVDQLLPQGGTPGRPHWHREFHVHSFGIHQDLRPDAPPVTHTPTPADFCCITDMRFDNEVARVKEVGGQCWKVKNEEAMQAMLDDAKRRGKTIHRSDLELPDEVFDVILDNNDWRNEKTKLRRQVFAALEATR